LHEFGLEFEFSGEPVDPCPAYQVDAGVDAQLCHDVLEMPAHGALADLQAGLDLFFVKAGATCLF